MAYLIFGLATITIIAIIAAALQVAIAQQNLRTIRIPTTVIESHGCTSCPSKEELDTALKNVRNSASAVVLQIFNIPLCGDGLWYRIAHLNMSDSSQQCPSSWKEVTMDGI
jgi:hypothetical protein